jgi:hypothetical protein
VITPSEIYFFILYSRRNRKCDHAIDVAGSRSFRE